MFSDTVGLNTGWMSVAQQAFLKCRFYHKRTGLEPTLLKKLYGGIEGKNSKIV
jgi:hypothetical protein